MRIAVRYSEQRREAILKKLLPPHSRTEAEAVEEERSSVATLYNWRKAARCQRPPAQTVPWLLEGESCYPASEFTFYRNLRAAGGITAGAGAPHAVMSFRSGAIAPISVTGCGPAP